MIKPMRWQTKREGKSYRLINNLLWPRLWWINMNFKEKITMQKARQKPSHITSNYNDDRHMLPVWRTIFSRQVIYNKSIFDKVSKVQSVWSTVHQLWSDKNLMNTEFKHVLMPCLGARQYEKKKMPCINWQASLLLMPRTLTMLLPQHERHKPSTYDCQNQEPLHNDQARKGVIGHCQVRWYCPRHWPQPRGTRIGLQRAVAD